MTSHLVAPLQPRKVAVSGKISGWTVWSERVGKLYPSHNLSNQLDKQETWMLKTVYTEWESVEVQTRTMLSCYVHRRTTTFCQALFLHNWIIMPRNNSYSFCDAYCHGHTGSRPERAIGSLLASPSGRYLEQTRDSDPQLALVHPRHAKLFHSPSWWSRSIGNRWKEAPGSGSETKYFTCCNCKRTTGCDAIHSIHTFACVQLVYCLLESWLFVTTSWGHSTFITLHA